MPSSSRRTMRLAACSLLILAIALHLALAGRGAQLTLGSAAPQSTSLNGPGNVFLTARLMQSGGSPGGATVSVAVADFNGDGKPDLAVADAGGNAVSILLGNGDGTFQAPKDIAAPPDAVYVATGDFNGDGKADLAVVCSVLGATPTVELLLGNGDGTFTLKTTLTGFTGFPTSVVLGDFNGDGKLDTAVIESQLGTNTPSSVVMYLGNGDGTVQAPMTTSNFGSNSSILAAAADFNKDGKLDLVLSELNTNQVVVLLGNGNGTFQAARSFALASTAGGMDVAVGDFNGDGIPDIAATNPIAGTVDILLGIGDGNFHAAVPFNAVPLGGQCRNLAVGDFNKDGKLDVITSVGTGDTVSVLFGKGDGTFSAPLLLATNQQPGQLAVADLNGDGNLDWVAGSAQQTRLAVTLGNGNGTFQDAVNYAVGGTPAVASGDFNKDGNLDLVTVNGGTSDISMLLGNGDGSFQPAIKTAVSGAFNGGTAVADLNNDGNPDVVVTDSTGLPPRNVIVLLGKGDGTFAVPARYSTAGAGEGPIVIADFNGDGKQDIAVVNEADNNISLLLGNGDGTFQTAKVVTPALATDGFSGTLVAADLNGDGKMDLAITDFCGLNCGTLTILLGNGDGTFKSPVVLNTVAGATGLAAADLNKDGKLDLVVAGQLGTVDIFLGNGDGTFNTPTVLNGETQGGANSQLLVVAVGDFNLDGNMDVLVGNGAAYKQNPPSAVQLFLGNGSGTVFTGPQDYLAGASASTLAVGDFNRDGAPDVAVGDYAENVINVLLNQTPPPVSVSPKSLTFASQLVGTTSATQPITIKNNGAAATTITIAASGDFTQANTCPVSPATLAMGANCTINVAFKPTASGTRNGAMTITHNLAGSPQSVTVTGTGVAPIVTLGGTSINFGNQLVGSSSAVQMVSLSNTGTAALTISSIAITGTNSGDFSQTNTCGASVAAGSNCSMSVTFKPTATGARAASVTVTDNASGSPQSVSLSGAGTAPVVMLSATSLNFSGQLITTASAAQNVTLTNNGTATLNIANIALGGANTGDFSQTNTCGATLAAAANCMISVTFKPTATGNRTASVTITDDVTGSPQSVTLTGRGTDYSIDAASGGSLTASITAGQTATYNLQVTPISGFNGTVTLVCTGAPSEAVCTDSPPSATPNGGNAALFTATVTTRAPSLLLPRTGPQNWPPFTELRLILLLFTAFVLRVLLARSREAAALRRQPLGVVLALSLVLLVLTWAGACGSGGGGGGGPHDPGTPKGAHTLTITGSSGGVTRTLNLTLTVN